MYSEHKNGYALIFLSNTFVTSDYKRINKKYADLNMLPVLHNYKKFSTAYLIVAIKQKNLTVIKIIILIFRPLFIVMTLVRTF